MEMDGRGSAEYQIWEKRDILGILAFDFKSLEAKLANSDPSPSFSQAKTVEAMGDAVG